MDEKFDNELNFSKILFLHINRTLMSTNDLTLFMFNIETLEILLSPYLDDDYKKDLQVTKAFAHYQALDSMVKDRNEMIRQKRMELAITKFRALMSLAERKGLLLEKTDRSEAWDLPEEEESATNDDTNMEI